MIRVVFPTMCLFDTFCKNIRITSGGEQNLFFPPSLVIQGSFQPTYDVRTCMCRLNLILTPCLLVIARCQRVGTGSPASVDPWWSDSDIPLPTPPTSAVQHKRKQMSHISHFYLLSGTWKSVRSRGTEQKKRTNNFLIFTFSSYSHSPGQQAIMSRLLCDPNKTTWRGSQWLAEGFQNSGHH